MKPLALFIVFSVGLLNYLALVSALSFNIPPGQEKCLREEVHKDVLVTGEYKLSDAAHQRTHLTVSIVFEMHLELNNISNLLRNRKRSNFFKSYYCVYDQLGNRFNRACLVQERRRHEGQICFHN